MANEISEGRLHAQPEQDWRVHGIRVVRSEEKSHDTPVTLGMNRQVAVSGRRTQSEHLWAGTNTIEPGASTGPHHHGPLESIIFVVQGHALMRWGSHLEWITEAHSGDFLLVPPYVPHQELNGSKTEILHCVLVRSGPEDTVVNLELIDVTDTPEWIDTTR